MSLSPAVVAPKAPHDPLPATPLASAINNLNDELLGAIIDQKKSATTNGQDKLFHLFDLQHKLNARCGVSLENLTNDQKAEWTLKYTRAMSQEIAELIDSVPWKWWAKYQKFDEQNAKVEIVDLFHFLISLAQVYGMSAEDVYQAYLKKNAVNIARQDSGYETKNEEDSRHI